MNIEQIRSDTPGVEKVMHFNNAGASLQTIQVLSKIREYQDREFLYGGYETAARYHEEIESTYDNIASFINAERDEIALLENATSAWDMAFHSIPFEKGDIIITSFAEYASNFIAFLQMQKRKGIEIVVIPNDESGQFDVSAFEQKINPKVKLIAVNHMPTNSGLVNPIEKIGEIARANDILFLVDACQSIGHIPIDVKEIGCDFLSATGRKYLRGPRGTGFLYASNRILDLEPIFLDLSSAEWTDASSYTIRKDAKKFENWECNYAIRLGLNESVKYAMAVGTENIWKRTNSLGKELRSALEMIDGVNILDRGSELSGIVTFNMDNFDEKTIKARMDKNAINVAIAPWNAALLDMQDKGITSLVRASVHYYNTRSEIEYFVESLQKLNHES